MEERRGKSGRFAGAATAAQPIAFGDFRFTPRTGELWRGDVEVKLTPRAAEVLAVLVYRSGELVTKQELFDEVWQVGAVGDEALTSCVQELRRALGDDSRQPRYIETRYRRGYRLLAPVGPATMENRSAAMPSVRELPDKPSIAVLPFQNMSGDADQEYFADGLAEDIIAALSRVGWFFVTARNSSFVYKGKAVDIRQVGRELGVRYVLEGSIRKSGNRLRMTAQLIEAASCDHLWSDKYDGTLEQVFDLQDQIVERLIGALEPRLRSSEVSRARQKRPESLTAFDLVLQALPKHATMTAEGFAEAIELLDRTIALDPTYAQALGYAALCRALRPFHGASPDPAGDLREASALARRALDSDPSDPIALRAVAISVVLVSKDYRAGLDLMDRSLAVDGNAAFTWGMRGWVNVWAGEAAAAIKDFERAVRLSPFDPWNAHHYANGMAFALNLAGDHAEALAWARKCMQHNPHWSGSHRQLIASHFLAGQHVEARRAAIAYLQIEPGFTVHYWVENGPFRRTPEQERLFSALHLAGLPE